MKFMKSNRDDGMKAMEVQLKRKEGDYLIGPNLTLADLSAFFILSYELVMERSDFKEFPAIHAWHTKMLEQKEVAEIHGQYMEAAVGFKAFLLSCL
mmetsp:Transcript_2820/g.2639  ORF Transcript_2820/g.2639 Transcript_2820/m.2639 type:complete len:96 (+) Transcript_2820:407-694(+)